MQKTSELDSQVKVLFSKSNESKPYGFALILETDDGTPAFFTGKTEIAARNQAKEELKKAKKKKMVIGLAFVKDKKLVLKQGSKPILGAMVGKAFKKLKNKTAKYKGVFGKTPDILVGAPQDEIEEMENATGGGGTESKYLQVWQGLQATFQDLEGAYQDAQSDFNQITSLLSSETPEVTAIKQRLQAMFKTVEDFKSPLHSSEKLILSEAPKDDIKQALKQLRGALKTEQQNLDSIVADIQNLSIDGGSSDSDLEVGSIAWLLKQATTLQNQMTGKVGPKLEDELTALVGALTALSQQEQQGNVTSTKEEDKQKSALQSLAQRCTTALVEEQLKDQSKALGERAASISRSAFGKAQMEVLRFQSAVLAHNTVLNDFRFPAIRKGIFALSLQDTLSDTLTGKNTTKELAKAISAYEKSQKTSLNQWKTVDKSSPFGKFSVYATLSTAFKQISKLK